MYTLEFGRIFIDLRTKFKKWENRKCGDANKKKCRREIENS